MITVSSHNQQITNNQESRELSMNEPFIVHHQPEVRESFKKRSSKMWIQVVSVLSWKFSLKSITVFFYSYFPVPVSAQSPSCNLKKPSQAIYVPPQRKSSMQNHNLSDDWKESEKIKPRVESGTKVISPIRKKSIRVEMR